MSIREVKYFVTPNEAVSRGIWKDLCKLKGWEGGAEVSGDDQIYLSEEEARALGIDRDPCVVISLYQYGLTVETPAIILVRGSSDAYVFEAVDRFMDAYQEEHPGEMPTPGMLVQFLRLEGHDVFGKELMHILITPEGASRPKNVEDWEEK